MIKFATVTSKVGESGKVVTRAIVQHERNFNLNASLAYFAEETGYKVAVIKAALLAFVAEIKKNAQRGKMSRMDGVFNLGINCKGSFASANGPWVTGDNYLELGANSIDAFKSYLEGIETKNITSSLKPTIDTVLDTITGVYDVVTGTDIFSVGGYNLLIDDEATDEGVELVNDNTGTVYACAVTSSDIGSIKAHLAASAPAGAYTLRVKTRCGLEGVEVKTATRKIAIA